MALVAKDANDFGREHIVEHREYLLTVCLVILGHGPGLHVLAPVPSCIAPAGVVKGVRKNRQLLRIVTLKEMFLPWRCFLAKRNSCKNGDPRRRTSARTASTAKVCAASIDYSNERLISLAFHLYARVPLTANILFLWRR
jgi:hypothetical protein